MKRKADMGIGTLIIFIAMILVAAIAAGVLIQTATSLQNRALLTGERSQSQVSTSIRPIVVYAEDGSSDNNVDDFFATLKLAPGSDAVKLEHVLVEFALSNASDDLLYDDSVSSCDSPVNTGFYVEVLIEGDNHDSDYLQRGDVVKLCFKSGRTVGEDETVRLSLIPRVGSPTVIETAMPDIITQQRINIFP